MIKLMHALRAWNTSAFNKTVQQEIQSLDKDALPLQQGLSHSSYVGNENFKIIILGSSENSDFIFTKAGVFYTGIIAGCNCSDDPTPIDEQTEYCELNFSINKKTAETSVSLLDQ